MKKIIIIISLILGVFLIAFVIYTKEEIATYFDNESKNTATSSLSLKVEEKIVVPTSASTSVREDSPFEIISITPEDKSKDISIDSSVIVTFNKAIKQPTFGFGEGMKPVAVRSTLSFDKKVLKIEPKDLMKNNTEYGFVLMEIKSIDGDTLPDIILNFTTVK